jgi:repressor LexA
MHYGKVPSIRELMKSMDYKSPRSAMLLMEELEGQGYLKRKDDGSYSFIKDLDYDGGRTIAVPLVGSVACGAPLLAEENIEAMIPVSISLAHPGNSYFLLRATGNSMDKAGIESGDLLLIKRQSHVEHNGQIIVALIDDEATVKEYFQKDNIVQLIPRSTDPKHHPIILTREFLIQGVVVTVIPSGN